MIELLDEKLLEGLVALSLGNVSGYLGRTDDIAGEIADRGYRDRELQLSPVLGNAHRIEMINPLSALELVDDLDLFVLQSFGDDPEDGLANHFLGSVAKNALGAPIPGDNDAVEVLANDRIIRRRNNGREPLRVDVIILSVGYLYEDIHCPYNPTVLVLQEFGVRGKWHPSAVGTLGHGLYTRQTATFLQHYRHWTVFVLERLAVWPP